MNQERTALSGEVRLFSLLFSRFLAQLQGLACLTSGRFRPVPSWYKQAISTRSIRQITGSEQVNNSRYEGPELERAGADAHRGVATAARWRPKPNKALYKSSPR